MQYHSIRARWKDPQYMAIRPELTPSLFYTQPYQKQKTHFFVSRIDLSLNLGGFNNEMPKCQYVNREGAIFCIKCRKIPADRVLLWEMNSRYRNMVARCFLSLRHVQDRTAGVRAICVSVLRRMELDRLQVEGYTFQIARLQQVDDLAASTKEVPVKFTDRTEGKTKLGISEILKFIGFAFRAGLFSSNYREKK